MTLTTTELPEGVFPHCRMKEVAMNTTNLNEIIDATFKKAGPIFDGEPVRYRDKERWMWNNGFHRRWLRLGAVYAAVINAARRGDEAAVEYYARNVLGGLRQVRTFVRSAIRLASRLPADVPPYRIEDGVVLTPRLGWRWSGRKPRWRRQVAEIEWRPMWGRRRAAQ